MRARMKRVQTTEAQSEGLAALSKSMHGRIGEVISVFAMGCVRLGLSSQNAGAATSRWLGLQSVLVMYSATGQADSQSNEELFDIAEEVQKCVSTQLADRINAKRSASIEGN